MADTKKRIDRSDIISITALLMSMMALFVSIYEANILKAQQKIMVSQERTAVWPYVDGYTHYEYADQITVAYQLENKGIGPSRIRNMQLTVNGQEVSNYSELKQALQDYFPDTVKLNPSFLSFDNQILTPNETVETLAIEISRFPGDIEKVRALPISYTVCYCSIYNDCWYFVDRNDGQDKSCD